MKEDKFEFNVNNLINGVFEPKDTPAKESLKELFERRIFELNISTTSALNILGIATRSLTGILEGSQKRIDYTSLIKIANFLQVPKELVITLYIEELEKNFPEEIGLSSDRVEFLKENFDLAALKKVGFIKSIADYAAIADSLTKFYELNDILDYQKPEFSVAFSAGITKPKHSLNRNAWLKAAKDTCTWLNNSNHYDRQKLIAYFPEIRWHSMNVQSGFKSVIKDLYKIGVTVLYQPSLPSIHLRGATIAVNNKPCIIITDYRGFYPTLFFALIHELYHVLFDWEDILANEWHVSDSESERSVSIREKEEEADKFAREYLFSKEKTQQIKKSINDYERVSQYAAINHVHPSFIHVFYARDVGSTNKLAWARAHQYNPDITGMLSAIGNLWNNWKPVSKFAKDLKIKLYS